MGDLIGTAGLDRAPGKSHDRDLVPWPHQQLGSRKKENDVVLKAEPLAGHIGAEIVGVDLSGALTDTLCAELREALARHLVLVFRDQTLDLAAQKRVTTVFGPLMRIPYVEPDRPIVVARELTKRYEEFWRGTVASALEQFTERSPRGEFTLVLAGAQPKPADTSESALQEQLRELMGRGLSRSQASRQVAKQTGCDRRTLYQLSLTLEGVESDNPPVQ